MRLSTFEIELSSSDRTLPVIGNICEFALVAVTIQVYYIRSMQTLPTVISSVTTVPNSQDADSSMKHDVTGMFHWCPSRDLEKSIMVCLM